MSEQLKPCPFCSSTITFIGDDKTEMRYYVYCAYCSASTGRRRTESDAIDSWNTRHDGWIPVTERLPELTRFYLVTYKDGKHPNAVMELRFNPSYGWASPDGEKLNVVAWQPMLEPYKESK